MRTTAAYSLATGPTSQAVTLEEAKSILNVYHNDDDALVIRYIKAATQMFESHTNYLVMTQTWDLYLDQFPVCHTIQIEKWPVSSVSYVKYYDANNALQTVTSTDYVVDTVNRVGRITPTWNSYWPQTYIRENCVNVRFVAGQSAASTVPEDVKTWILNMVVVLYELRGIYREKQTIMSPVFQSVISKYKVGLW